MMTRWVARGLRTTGVAVAVLAWVDPALTRTRARPLVAVIAADADAATLGAMRGLLANAVRVTAAPDPDADAWVIVAGRPAAIPAAPDGIPLSVVTAEAPTRAVQIARVDAPSRLTLGSRARVTVALRAEALAGTDTTVILRSGSLEIARSIHRWTRADERATVVLEPLLAEAGTARLRVEAQSTGGPAAVTDLVIDVDERPLPVLVVDGRPSWMTTFVRRALQADAGLEVTSLTRISRGISAEHGTGSGDTLTDERLANQAVVVAGGLEALSANAAAAVERFARRGGSVLLVPDALALGAARTLVPAAELGERLLESPVRVALPAGVSSDRSAAVWASELARPRRLLAGAVATGLAPGPAADDAAIVDSPLGAGRVVYAGTLDAWRFRDREEGAFDRAWPVLVRQLGASSLERVIWQVRPAVARPGDQVEATLTIRDGLAPGDTVGVEARVGETPIRMRPDAIAGTFTAALNAPATPGVFAVSVKVAGCRAPGGVCASTAYLVVAADAAAATRPATLEAIRAGIEARGGVMVESGRLDRLHAHLRGLMPSARAPDTWFPMRSTWWLLPFALSLGGEWYLRRRNGLR